MTLPFETFWNWLVMHPNCIIRGGSHDCVLYDDEDLYWHFAQENDGLVVQLLRGKRPMGELFVDPEKVTYVQSSQSGEVGEFTFELVSETEADRHPAYFFVMAHDYEEEGSSPRRVH